VYDYAITDNRHTAYISNIFRQGAGTMARYIKLIRTEQNINFITLKLLQFLVTLHTYTTIYNFGDKSDNPHHSGRAN